MSKSKRQKAARSRPEPARSRRSKDARPQKGIVRERRLTLALCLGLLAITFAVFGRSVQYDFFNYDDSFYVYQNPLVSNGLTRAGLITAFTHPLVGNWHPLTSISLMLDAQLFGLHAGGYHLVNVLLHSLAVILLFLALREMTGALWRSAWVAAVFAIHPLRAESVVWISERKDVLSAVFFFAGLIFYTRYAARPALGKYLLVLLTLTLGLLSKAMLVTFPFLLLLLDYWPLRRLAPGTGPGDNPERPTISRLLLEKLPLLLVVVGVSIATVFAQEPALQAAVDLPLRARAENAIVTVWVYLRQLVWPVHLGVFYPHPKLTLAPWLVMLAFLGLVLVTLICFRLRKSYPYLGVGWLWYLGMLVPVIGIVQVGWQAHADRYTYLPQTGILIMIAWGLNDLRLRLAWPKILPRSLAISSILALALVACRQVGYWSSSVTLWEHTLAITTGNDVAERGLGTALLAIGRIDEAITHDRAALQIRPNDANGLTNLANALFQKGELPEAIEKFRQVVRLRPNDSEVRRNLGKALYRSGAVAESITEFETALRLRPHDSDAAYSLGNALLQKGDVNAAIEAFRKAIAIRPQDLASHYNLGIALQRAGETETAIAEFRETLRLDPKKVDARNNLAIALLKEGRTEEAIATWHAALQIDPQNAEFHANLAVAYLNQNRIAETIAQWHEALRLQPDKLPILLSLAWILATAPEDNVRNGSEARELAKRAFAAGSERNLLTYRVLAAAEAEAGNFGAALKTAREGIEKATAGGQPEIRQLLEVDSSLYDQLIPLRDPTHGRGGDNAR
jgi:tetratricopeptide (TPR) repeat protein